MPSANRNALGFPETWTKTFSGHWLASLGLIDVSPHPATPGKPHTYVLNAAAPPIDTRGGREILPPACQVTEPIRDPNRAAIVTQLPSRSHGGGLYTSH